MVCRRQVTAVTAQRVCAEGPWFVHKVGNHPRIGVSIVSCVATSSPVTPVRQSLLAPDVQQQERRVVMQRDRGGAQGRRAQR